MSRSDWFKISAVSVSSGLVPILVGHGWGRTEVGPGYDGAYDKQQVLHRTGLAEAQQNENDQPKYGGGGGGICRGPDEYYG